MKFIKKNWKAILLGLGVVIAGAFVGKKYLPRT